MKKLIPFLGLLLINNAFAHGGYEFLFFYAGGAILFILFHIIYAAIMTAKSPQGKKLNTFIWSFFLPPFLWVIFFYIGRIIVYFIGGVATYVILALTVFIIPVGLYYVMKNNNFFNNIPE